MTYSAYRAFLGTRSDPGASGAFAFPGSNATSLADSLIQPALAACNAVIANATVAADPTALALANTAHDAVVPIQGLAGLIVIGDVALFINKDNITTRDKFRDALRAAVALYDQGY